MRANISHIQLNIRAANLSFYKELMAFLGMPTIYEDDTTVGVDAGNGASLWWIGCANEAANDYDGPGMNHLGLGAASQADVDAAAVHLRERGVELLFETPRHRPEFAGGEDQTYYQVMFETPDRVLLEFVYIGPKTA